MESLDVASGGPEISARRYDYSFYLFRFRHSGCRLCCLDAVRCGAADRL